MMKTFKFLANILSYQPHIEHESYLYHLCSRLFFITFLVLASNKICAADEDTPSLQEQKQLMGLGLNDLLNVKVTSVTKNEQKLSESAAAIFVIRQQDIKRAGVTTIPDALRMVPGVDVARINGNQWAITVRGFNGRFANKLLVLIDGRSVYTPFFSGVYWDIQDTVLEDIERIEVIRGPGASLWGANAVNGVINIVTKKAEDSQGAYLMLGGGSKERLFGSVRYGSKLANSAYYKVYAKFFERSINKNITNQRINDDWRIGQGGFKLDWDASVADKITLQGDYYQGSVGETGTVSSLSPLFSQVVNSDGKVVGGNILTRWTKQINATDSFKLQLYYDYTLRDRLILRHETHIFDLDFQHRLTTFDDHNITWGLGYRHISDNVRNSFTFSVSPDKQSVQWFSLFVQDEVKLLDNELKLILGSKFEHNDYSGFEVQPTARLLWQATENQTLWASVSRAVRTPSRAEESLQINAAVIPGRVNSVIRASGAMGNASEQVWTYELGYRAKPYRPVSIDLALFYSDYANLVNSQVRSPAFDQGNLIIPTVLATDMAGEVYGAELASSWQVLELWLLNASYSYLQMQLHNKNGVTSDTVTEAGLSPRHKLSLRSSLDITSALQWDLWLRYSDTLPTANIKAYTTLDTRLAWRPVKEVELSIVGQNLLDKRHPEISPIDSAGSQVERSVYGKIEFRF